MSRTVGRTFVCLASAGVLLALTLVWIEPLQQASQATRSEHAAAETLYRDRCAACHGAAREGGAGPRLVDIGDRRSTAKIARIAQFGKGRNKPNPMPAGLTDADEARLLARWLSGPAG
jgi:mono/diheme cytochrome c family protein